MTQYITEGGCELVLVSAHLGARVKGKNQPELAGHDRWQGRVYRIRGSEPGYPNLLETTGYDIDPETGEGRVVNPLGLHGYNCRHSHKPWDRRLRNPYLDENGDLTIDTEENRQRYRLEQRQRAMERAIRQTRRQLQVKALELEADPENADLQAEYSALENRLSRQDEAYNQFCQENGLTAQYDRLRVAEEDAVSGQYRRKQNTGDFSGLNEVMELKHVKQVASEMGLDFGKTKIQIVRDAELLDTPNYGYTFPDGSKVQLYPNAFRNREQMVRTLGHEYIHLQQIKKSGIVTTTEELLQREQEAYASEERWWLEYVKKTGYRK